MGLVATALAAGVLGTLAMDGANHILARAGWLVRIDVAMIGRMAGGWAQGRFRYHDPGEMRPLARERLWGWLAHYAIGIGLALAFVVGWALLKGGPASPAWALAYGLATTAASLLLVYPAMGLGVLGRRAPDGLKATLSPVVNHLFFGCGTALGVALAA